MLYDPRRSRAYQSIRARMRAKAKADNEPCAICGRAIDYDAPPRHPSSWTCDHIKPVDKYPELALDPANCQSACKSCNSSKGNTSANVYGLGHREPRLKG